MDLVDSPLSANHQISKAVKSYVRPFFAAAFILMVVVAMMSDAIYDTGDGIMHYQIARWSWQHPDLFLHHWGKPLFTLLCSPFAQFGYKGAVFFNILCHVSTAWITWRIADRMKLPYSYLAGPLVIFAPLSWGVAQSGLTEPLFALTLMSGIYFITGGKNNTAAFIISLLPFARTEGFLLVPLFGLFFLIRREYIAMALLSTGTVIYSVIGGLLLHHDFLWIIHQNPYVGEAAYGHGELFHFVANNEFLFGWSITALITLGLCTLPFRRQFTPRHSLAEMLLIVGSFVVFFIAHSIFWWKGIFGSYGLLRVIASVIPCAVLISLRGLQLITWPIYQRKIAVIITSVVIVGLTIFNTMNQKGLVMKPDSRQSAAEEVARQIKELKLDMRLMYCSHPIMPYLLEKDPFDNSQCRHIGEQNLDEDVRIGAIVVWDSNLGAMDNAKDDFIPLSGKPGLISIPPVISIKDESGTSWLVFDFELAGIDSAKAELQ
jgi:hypothetical protein